MTRVQLAMDMTPKQLANVLGVPLRDVVDRHGPRADMSSSVTDPFWLNLRDYVDERVAGYLAIKEELDRKFRRDKREHDQRTHDVLTR